MHLYAIRRIHTVQTVDSWLKIFMINWVLQVWRAEKDGADGGADVSEKQLNHILAAVWVDDVDEDIDDVDEPVPGADDNRCDGSSLEMPNPLHYIDWKNEDKITHDQQQSDENYFPFLFALSSLWFDQSEDEDSVAGNDDQAGKAHTKW